MSFTISPKNSGIILTPAQIVYYAEMPNYSPVKVEIRPNCPEVEHLALRKKKNGEYFPFIGQIRSMHPSFQSQAVNEKFSVRVLLKVVAQLINGERVEIENNLLQNYARNGSCFFIENNFLAEGKRIILNEKMENIETVFSAIKEYKDNNDSIIINGIDICSRRDHQSTWATNNFELNQEVLFFASPIYCRLRKSDGLPYINLKCGEYMHHVSHTYMMPLEAVGGQRKIRKSFWKRSLVVPGSERSGHINQTLQPLPARVLPVPVSNLPKPQIKMSEAVKRRNILESYSKKAGANPTFKEPPSQRWGLAAIQRPKAKPQQVNK